MRFYMTHRAREKRSRGITTSRLLSSLACFQPISLYSKYPRSSFSSTSSSSSFISSLPHLSHFLLRSPSFSLSLWSLLFSVVLVLSFSSCPGDSEVRSPHIYCSTNLSIPMGARSTAAWPFIVVYKLAGITRDHTNTHTRRVSYPRSRLVNRAGSGPRFNSTFHGFSSASFAVRRV